MATDAFHSEEVVIVCRCRERISVSRHALERDSSLSGARLLLVAEEEMDDRAASAEERASCGGTRQAWAEVASAEVEEADVR